MINNKLKCECFTSDDKHNLKFSVMQRKRKFQEEREELRELMDGTSDKDIQKGIDRCDKRIAQHIELYNKIVNIKVC